MVRMYDRTCLYCYKTNKPGLKKCKYCSNDLPYEDVEKELPTSREPRTDKEIMMEGFGVELPKGFKTPIRKEMRKNKKKYGRKRNSAYF